MIGFLIVLAIQPLHRAGADSQVHVITIKDFKYFPDTIVVQKGDVIKWVNTDIVPHTASEQGNDWDTGALKNGEDKTLSFPVTGPGSYYCRFHPTMRATIEVIDK